MIEGNPIPHILKDIENWSASDLALLVLYLNKGVYQQFIHKIMVASPEEIEKLWPIYKKMKAEVINSQKSLLSLEKYADYKINDAEKTAIKTALRAPIRFTIPKDVDTFREETKPGCFGAIGLPGKHNDPECPCGWKDRCRQSQEDY